MLKLILILMASFNSHAVDLLQESKDILCVSGSNSVLIDKRDRFIVVTENGVQSTFNSVEFLDSGILLKSKTSTDYALVQLTPKNTALVIMGKYRSFTEATCKDTGASKLCNIGASYQLLWTPEIMTFSEKEKSKVSYDVYHYGVYPNDGTYFMALDGKKQGLALVDFGSNISLVQGQYLTFSGCDYK